jgi:hypothetical protein
MRSFLGSKATVNPVNRLRLLGRGRVVHLIPKVLKWVPDRCRFLGRVGVSAILSAPVFRLSLFVLFLPRNQDGHLEIRTPPYFRGQFYFRRLVSLLTCLGNLRMNLSASRPKLPPHSSPVRQFLIERIADLIEMKTIRISFNLHKKSQLVISNRNVTQNAAISFVQNVQSSLRLRRNTLSPARKKTEVPASRNNRDTKILLQGLSY